MTPARFLYMGLGPALALLPTAMDSSEARALILAICLQETNLKARRQRKGPARGYAQFEEETVRLVLAHPAAAAHARAACHALDIRATAPSVYAAMEFNDVLTCVFARLLLWTDPHPLPNRDEPDRAWDIYAEYCWRPGAPHPETWLGNFEQAWHVVQPV